MARRIESNQKFNNVDILKFMEQIVLQHTQYYQSDFEIDKKVLVEVAHQQEQKTFIWLCRTHGTWLLDERNVFIRDTKEYNTFTFYMEQTKKPILAFVIEVAGACDDTVCGNIYAMDYAMFYRHIKDRALDEASQEELADLLSWERQEREHFPEGNSDAYISFMNKKEFIAIFETTLINAHLEVIALELLDNDTVEITFKGGGKRKVNIEADSYGAIICDVMKHCF